MPVTGPLSHIDISVGYPEKSIPFYDALLTSLGYRRWMVDQPEWAGDNPRRATWSIRCADGSIFGIEVRPARADSRDRRYDRYEPGPHHLAFHAESEEVVDRAYEAVVAADGEVLDAPTDYGGHPAYGEQYYAVFFADPDGVKLEVCYVKQVNP
ncbi:MAG: VOC family protein [Pseudomonadales bacterium]|nr:VOC family protein [Pseudomonadales bacterium]